MPTCHTHGDGSAPKAVLIGRLSRPLAHLLCRDFASNRWR